MFHLFKLFKEGYCFDTLVEAKSAAEFRCIPRPNDFAEIAEYFLRKALVSALSMVRDDRGQTPSVIVQFLLDQLQFNDNTANRYSDAHYIVTLIRSLGHTLAAVATPDVRQFGGQTAIIDAEVAEFLPIALGEVERFMSTDRLVPSYLNMVTVAGIEFKIKLMLASIIPNTPSFSDFFSYTRDGNYPSVRIAAFEAILLLKIFDVLPLLSYVFSVLRSDSSMLVRRRLAQALVTHLPILVAVRDIAAPAKETLVLEDGTEKKKDDLDVDKNVIKALRREVGRSKTLRDGLLNVLL